MHSLFATLLDRQIMRILVADQAFRVFFVQLFAVRLNMADAAIWNESMLAVATGATDLGMFAQCFAPICKCLAVAGTACA